MIHTYKWVGHGFWCQCHTGAAFNLSKLTFGPTRGLLTKDWSEGILGAPGPLISFSAMELEHRVTQIEGVSGLLLWKNVSSNSGTKTKNSIRMLSSSTGRISIQGWNSLHSSKNEAWKCPYRSHMQQKWICQYCGPMSLEQSVLPFKYKCPSFNTWLYFLLLPASFELNCYADDCPLYLLNAHRPLSE